MQYQYWVYNANANPAWSQLQGYSASATCTWTPAAAGDYLLSVTALDSTTDTGANTTCWYTITGGPLSAVSVTTAPTSPQPVNTPITLTAAATGGTGVQYQFWLYNANANPAWSQLQGYSASPTCTWTPADAGNYLLSATALDGASGTAVNDLLWYAITGGSLTAVSVSAAPASPQPVDTPVTFTAAATGGTSVQYQFWVYNANTNPAWSQLQGYSTSATCTWTPATPGNYLLSVTALDADGTAVNDLLWYTVNAALTLTVTAAPLSPQPVNTPITLTAVATGGTSVQYQFWLYNQNANPAWSQLQGYSTSATCTWTPATPGNYLLSVTALDADGTAVNDLLWYTVNAALTLSVTAAPLSPQPVNTPITLTAVATGGTSVQYQFWLYNANANPAWSQLQGYSASATCTWTPAAPGNYLFSVTALDAGGTAVNDLLWYTVNAGLTLSITPSLASPQYAGTPITLTAAATGGTEVQYQFWVYNAAANPAWQQLQGYSASATCVWTPATAGSYLLSVTAQDSASGMVVNQLLWYTITTPTSDEEAILALFAALQSAADAHSITGIMALFSPDYLQGGTDYAQVQANMEQGLAAIQSATAAITNVAINGDTALVTATIIVTYNNGEPPQSMTEPNTSKGISFGWLIKSNGQWLFYGDQQRASVQVTVGTYVDPVNGYFSLQMSAYGPQIATATVNGPNIPPTPLMSDEPPDGGYSANVTPSQTPQVGDAYTFDITYTDGTQCTLTAAVQEVITIAPTLTVTQPAGGGLAFAWTDVSAQAPSDAYYQLIVTDLWGNTIWSRNYPLSTLSGTFNDDGSATAQIQSGETYWCSIQLNDQYGDYAYTCVVVTMPGVTVQLTVGNDVDPVNGGYSVQLNAYGQMNANGSLITSITVSGPHISATPMSGDSSDAYYWLTVYPSQPPQVGDRYTFLVAYADGTQDTLTTTVQGVVTVAPTLTVTQPAGGGLAFTWTDVSAQVPNAASYQLSVQGFWQQQYPLSTLSGAFNEQLQNGTTYTCTLSIYDTFGDYAYTTVTVIIPGITVQMTVGNDVDPVNGGYSLQMNAHGQINANGSPITSITVSGPNIPTTSMTSDGSSDGWYYLTVSPSQPPQVSDVYTFLVSYADGTQTTQTATLQGVVTVAPTLTITQPAGGGLTFTWTDVSAQVPKAAYYQLSVHDQSGRIYWQQQYPLSTLSGAFNEQLQNGTTYTCTLSIYDTFGDYAYTTVTVIIPGITVQMTVGNDVDPVNGGYSLQMNAHGQINANGSPITSITVSGPNIPTTSMTSDGSSDGWYYLTVSPSQPPQVSDVYTFLVSYADGTQTTQTATLQGVVTVAPTLTITQPAGGGLTFTWTDVSAQVPKAAYYQLQRS